MVSGGMWGSSGSHRYGIRGQGQQGKSFCGNEADRSVVFWSQEPELCGLENVEQNVTACAVGRFGSPGLCHCEKRDL